MKISEMTTINFADFVETAGDSISNIMQNEHVTALFTDEATKNPVKWVANVAKVLCGPCRNDVLAVIGAMNGKTAEDIAQQNILATIGQLRSLYEDVKSADIPE